MAFQICARNCAWAHYVGEMLRGINGYPLICLYFRQKSAELFLKIFIDEFRHPGMALFRFTEYTGPDTCAFVSPTDTSDLHGILRLLVVVRQPALLAGAPLQRGRRGRRRACTPQTKGEY